MDQDTHNSINWLERGDVVAHHPRKDKFGYSGLTKTVTNTHHSRKHVLCIGSCCVVFRRDYPAI